MLSLLVEGFTQPQRSMRRILDMHLGPDAIVLLVILGYLVQAIFKVLLTDGTPEGQSIMAFHMVALIMTFGQFFMVSELVFSVGKMAGGTGTRIQTYVTLAWHTLMASFLLPILLNVRIDERTVPGADGDVTVPHIEPSQALLALIYLVILFWLLARYVAELHGFRNIWNVVGGLLMGSVAFLIAVLVVMTALGAG